MRHQVTTWAYPRRVYIQVNATWIALAKFAREISLANFFGTNRRRGFVQHISNTSINKSIDTNSISQALLMSIPSLTGLSVKQSFQDTIGALTLPSGVIALAGVLDMTTVGTSAHFPVSQ